MINQRFRRIVLFGLAAALLLGLAACGLWRVKAKPRWAPLLLAVGAVLFPLAQAQAEPNMLLYVAATISWLLGFAPLGLAMRRDAGRGNTHAMETVAT